MPEYDPTFCGYNKYRAWQLGDKRYGPDGEYGSSRLADVQFMTRLSADAMAHLLEKAADTLRHNADDLGTMADLYCFFREAPRIMPEVRCWGVVKVYADPGWPDAVSYGCSTQEQAEAVAAALTAHYAKKYPHRKPDQFVVRENCSVRPIDVLAPELTVERLLRGLGL
jgi:hypothetical protein